MCRDRHTRFLTGSRSHSQHPCTPRRTSGVHGTSSPTVPSRNTVGMQVEVCVSGTGARSGFSRDAYNLLLINTRSYSGLESSSDDLCGGVGVTGCTHMDPVVGPGPPVLRHTGETTCLPFLISDSCRLFCPTAHPIPTCLPTEVSCRGGLR